MTAPHPRAWVERLEAIGLAVRARILAARAAGDELSEAVAHEGGDTIFAVDRHVEPVIEAAIEAWPDTCKPLLLIAEGMGEDGRKRFGAADPRDAAPAYRLIIDPIDGTRNIMYDKRSAWFIAAVAPDCGEATTLANAVASVIVELPTSKAGYADVFTAVRGERTLGRRVRVDAGGAVSAPGEGTLLPLRPSAAHSLRHGFAQVSNFFPGTKVLASELMERIAEETLGGVEVGMASVFDDQYITTAGQMVELMIGHDRFCCDLRPLLYRLISLRDGHDVRGLECHPYDVAGALVAQQAGVIVTDGLGRALAPPLDVHTGVHWCGYANESIRAKVEPVIAAWFREQGLGEGGQ